MAKKKLPDWYLKQLSDAGKKGGKRSLQTLTPEQRAERARKAAAKSAEVRRKKQNPKQPTE